MENNIVKLNPKEYGLEETKAKEIESFFIPMLEKMNELEKEYNEVVSLPVSETTSKIAKTLRLKYVKVRTGTAAIHKEVKAYFLAGSRFVDGWKNTQLFASQGKEATLESIEKHFERLEKERMDKIQKEREQIYKSYGGEASIDFRTMNDEIWNQFIEGTKLAYEKRLEAEKQRIEAERKAEQERIEKERKEREEREAREKAEAKEKERIKLENERLKKEAEEKELQRQKEIAEQKRIEKERLEKERAAKLEAELKEKARLETERKERERVEAEYQAKLEEERKKQEATLEAERKEKARLEAELEAKKAEEKRIADEKAEQERQAKLAPDKEKLKAVSDAISTIISRISKTELSSVKGHTILQDVSALLKTAIDIIEERNKKL